jgi:glycosyltransferase involved in cell wall biosynthesis
MSLPKVLILGQPFNNDTGGGITLSNLFAGWDREKLAVACSGYLLNDIDTSVCNTYYQLGHKEKKWMFPFNLIRQKYPSGLANFGDKKVYNLSKNNPKLRVQLINKYVNPALDYLGFNHVIFRTDLSDDFKNFLDDFNPDVIYGQASSRDGLLFCSKVSAYLNKPFIFHMMDDWPSTITDNILFKSYWDRKIDGEFRALLGKTDLLLTICDEMSREYQRRYGVESKAFHNPIDLQFWKQSQRTEYSLPDSPTLLYAGRVGLGIQESLINIAKAIEQVNLELGLSIKFVLQTAEAPSWTSNFSHVLHKPFVPYQELPRVFSGADFLILPYDFSRKSIKYIQFSMPTKASEYMASGTPTIVFAPEVTAMAKYAQEYGWADVVTENDTAKLAETLKNLVNHEEHRRKIAETANAVAEKRHRADLVTEAFRAEICSLARPKVITEK